MMKKLIYIVFLAFCGVLVAQEETEKPPVIAIRVPLGETVTIKGFDFEFKEVLEDSRCPTNVECVWAGRARVSVVVSDGQPVEWIFGEVGQGETKEKIYDLDNNWSVEGVALAPYPREPGEEMEYVLLVRALENQ